jgi:hypothetical protein
MVCLKDRQALYHLSHAPSPFVAEDVIDSMRLTSENKTQTQWLKERKVYYTSWPAPEYLQNGAGPKLRVVEVFILRKAAAGK